MLTRPPVVSGAPCCHSDVAHKERVSHVDNDPVRTSGTIVPEETGVGVQVRVLVVSIDRQIRRPWRERNIKVERTLVSGSANGPIDVSTTCDFIIFIY